MNTRPGPFAPLQDHDFAILVALWGRPRHAYGIRDRITQDMQGRPPVSESTFYTALKRLLEWNWIEEVDKVRTAPSAQVRPHYGLTRAGEAAFRQELRRLKGVVDTAERRLLSRRYGTSERMY